jgi:hypothetical protein
MTVTQIKGPSILDQARAEVAKENAEKAKRLMIVELRALSAAEAVVAGIKLKLEDLQAQVDAGTL